MPRIEPPEGYLSATPASKRLGISTSMLNRLALQGKLKRYGERQHKYYKITELDALRQLEQVEIEPTYRPGGWRKNPHSTFRHATEQDIPAIMEMNARAFPPEGLPLYTTWLTWLQKNPESLQVVVNQESEVVGYIALLVMRKGALHDFLRNKIAVDAIGPEHLDVFRPGVPLHLYVMSMCVDPKYGKQEHGEYAARLLHGIFSFFLDLAKRGIEIETVTARAHTKAGLRLVRKLGMPQVKSPVPGKSIFAATVAESGMPLFEQYSELLERWKAMNSAK